MPPSLHRILCHALLACAASAAAAQALQTRPADMPAQSMPTLESASPLVLLPGTSLQVEILHHYPMRIGEAIEGRLMHPLYSDDHLVVPSGTPIHGTIVSLAPAHSLRLRARLHGDFTPFHIATVRFNQLLLPGGPVYLAAATANDGTPVVHLVAPGAKPHLSLPHRVWAGVSQRAHDQIAVFTAPGKADRALQFVYHQLPWHPERIEAHTAWSFDLTSPLQLPALTAEPPPSQVTSAPGAQETWTIHAVLLGELSSARAHPGDAVQALVVEPVYGRNQQLVVPQGSTLIGKVTAVSAARSLGRNGKLRFTFQQLQMSRETIRPIEGALAGAATPQPQDLSLDAEGTLSPKNRADALAPLFLSLLAAHAFDEDGSIYASNAVASNGFGLLGRIVGVTAANRYLAAGLGSYGAALSFYDNFLRNGRDVVFPKDTRIEIETTPLRAPTLTPAGR
ncbi:MAG TPA: hypothetical protein VN151_06300 [Terracidiphilus sp.]|nr:hypothetical protein [Terracidiphilus sp.]